MMGISEGVLPSFIRDTSTPGARGCFVLFIFMDLGQRVSTLTPGGWRGYGAKLSRNESSKRLFVVLAAVSTGLTLPV